MNVKNFQAEALYTSGRRGGPPKHGGFTLIELMVSVTIVGILAGIAIPLFTGYRDRANISKAGADIQSISLAIVNYYADNDQYPGSLAAVGYDTLLDPWGHPYKYLNISTATKGQMRKDKFLVPINTDFDLYSMGKDGMTTTPLNAKNSKDDIIRANNGAFIGLASDF